MRIAFVLPMVSAAPVGGYKVVYELAGRLADRGHEAAVLHTVDWRSGGTPRQRARRRARLWRMRRDRVAIVPWMEVDPRVELSVVLEPGRLEPPRADALLATAWVTAPLVAKAAGERGFYLIQGYETWGTDPGPVRDTWRLPLRKIVVSRWLEEVAIEMGEGARTSYVPIGVDLDRWGVDVPVQSREARVGVTFSPFKDPADALATIASVRRRVPDLAVSAFGTGSRPDGLPGWADYARRPSQAQLRALYNSCAVFLQAGGREGWGLPAAEAMACGCALVTYDTGGSREYAEDGETAVVVHERRPERLAEELAALLGDRPRRLELSRRGRERVGGFTWTRSVDSLEAVLSGSRAGERAR